MKIWNIQYKKLKDILLLVGLDLIAIGASTALSLLIVNMQIDIALSLLYWFLINIAVTSPAPPRQSQTGRPSPLTG